MSEAESTESGFDGLPSPIGEQQAAEALSEAATETKSTPSETPREKSEPTERSNGYQPYVDLSTIPDEATRKAVEARFAHMSRLIKKTETKYGGEINQWRDVAAEQARLIEELQSGVGAVVDHLQGKSIEDAESHWKAVMKTAFESGDVNAQMEANDKLIDIRTQKALLKQQKTQKPQQPKQEASQPKFPTSATEIGNQGLADGEITSDDMNALSAWQEETDEYGNLVRPWAISNNPNQLPAALPEAIAVFKNPRYAKLSMMQKLEEIDRRMGTKKASNSQNVMGGGLTGGRKIEKVTLSPDIERMAIRTKFGGPKAKSDAEHIEAYRKQMMEVKAKKGSR